MERFWICRAGTVREAYEYAIHVGKKPGKPAKDQDKQSYWPDADDTFCWEDWDEIMGRDARLKGGAGPVEFELVPKSRGKKLKARLEELGGDRWVIIYHENDYYGEKVIAEFKPDFWNRIAPAKLKLKRKNSEVMFALKKKGK